MVNVPRGWRLVPEEPTEAMWMAGFEANLPYKYVYSAIYRAMIDAAPAAPASSSTACSDPLAMPDLRAERGACAELCQGMADENRRAATELGVALGDEAARKDECVISLWAAVHAAEELAAEIRSWEHTA